MADTAERTATSPKETTVPETKERLPEFVSPAAVAAVTGYGRRRIQQLCAQGVLEADQAVNRGLWRIKPGSVLRVFRSVTPRKLAAAAKAEGR
jgi:hypothetical protein